MRATVVLLANELFPLTISDMPTIGVCALQGAFREHIEMLAGLDTPDLHVIEVRDVSCLASLDGLIIPGGESTSMRTIAELDGFLPALKRFVDSGKPCWGTCAGCILLSDRVSLALGGGHLDSHNDMSLDSTVPGVVGGLPIVTCRNYFGRQLQSFQTVTSGDGIFTDFSAVFIRAPAIAKVSPGVQVLATVLDERVIVAVRKDNILATCFHPELSNDNRIHRYFISMLVRYTVFVSNSTGY